jgi:putative transposase
VGARALHLDVPVRAARRRERAGGVPGREAPFPRLARAHARAAAVRADVLHGFTAKLAREHGVVVVEDLATKNLMANRSLAAAIGDQGWGELARQLTYKTARHGGQLIVAARWFASGHVSAWRKHWTPRIGALTKRWNGPAISPKS